MANKHAQCLRPSLALPNDSQRVASFSTNSLCLGDALMPRSSGFLADDNRQQTNQLLYPLHSYRIFLFHKRTCPPCLKMQSYLLVKYAVFDRGDCLLQRGTIYGAHRMSRGTIYDDTSGVGGPVNSLQVSEIKRYLLKGSPNLAMHKMLLSMYSRLFILHLNNVRNPYGTICSLL